jgi:hydrogenase nickel incorporation protein HypA/HybF
MHELSIASAILDRAQAASRQNGDARVTKVGLRIGEISGVDQDALRFGFEVLCKDTPMQGVVLEIDYRRRKQRCNACSLEFEPESFITTCPSCRSDDSTCVAGKELDVMFIELEDDAPCA